MRVTDEPEHSGGAAAASRAFHRGPAADRAATGREATRREIVRLLESLGMESQAISQAFAANHDLSRVELEALLHVMQAEERSTPMTAGQLAEAIGVTSGAATGLIDRLERVGHLSRSRDEQDRRRVLVHYGETARKVAGDYFGPLGAATALVLDEFDDAELAVVQRFLARMVPTFADHAERVQRGGAHPSVE